MRFEITRNLGNYKLYINEEEVGEFRSWQECLNRMREFLEARYHEVQNGKKAV